MNATTRFLARFCREHRLDEKTFVVPSFSVGHQIGQALAGAGEAWVNLRFVTLGALAQETAAAELLRQGRRLIPETGLLVLADSLFRELQEASSLEYFGRLRARPGLARALVRAIRALRLSGLGSGAIDAERFCLGPKGRDIIRLLSRYEAALDALRAFDIGGLYAAARDAATGETAVPGCGNGVWFLCLEDLALSRVEGEFLRAVAGDRLVVVPRDPAFGLERPRGRFVGAPYTDGPPAKAPAPTSDAERLSWLFAPADAPPPAGDGSVGLFRAVGQANECREVVRRVLAEGWPFDRVEVIAPPGSVYPALFHLLAARCALPVTLADGMPLLFTTPGRVLSGLADWVEGRFQVSGLCHLIESGDLALRLRDGETEVPGERAARLLWNAMIGWGRDRYLERLDAHRTRLEADLRRPPRGEDEERSSGAVEETRRAAREVGRLREVVRDLLACVPDFGPGDAVEFGALASGLAEALTRYVRVRSGVGDQDGEALSLVIAELGRIADEERALAGVDGRGPRPLRLDEALERLRAAVSSLTVGASSPLPGHLHVSSFGSGGFSGRPVTFVVGLNDTAVPGEGLQDPVLLDAERQALSESLPTSADALKANLHSLATMLASLRGRVVLSCSSYDIMDERRLHPSSVLLQALRLVRGEPGLDYSDLDRDFRDGAAETGRSDPAGFVPDGPGKTLDERDWWFLRLAGGRSRDRLETVKACFPTLADGIAAAEARAGTALTAYEGLVKIDGRRFDPLLNHDLTLSASRLELLAKCPYAYFLRYVLEVEPPRDLELDRSRWLDPMQRGTLIHRILYEFMSEILKRGERVSAGGHAPLMANIAASAIREFRKDVPPPSEGIFEKECRDIHDALDIFLRAEGGREPGVRPIACEKDFRDVAVDAGRGWFKLRGVIDRIDRTGPGAYRIIDYKTGSYRDFEDLEAFDRGRRIQHALYAVAAEKFLGRETGDPEPRVTESGYFFPTRRGEGREIMVGAFDRDRLRELLSDLLALISGGYFVTTTEDDCGFCDFAPVCGGSFEGTKDKLAATPEVAEALDKLKRYA